MSIDRSRDPREEITGEDAPQETSRFAFLVRLAHLPRKKLIALGLLAATALLALIGVGVLAVSLLKKPKASEGPPLPPPEAAKAEMPERHGKPTVEERFEAIKRGDLSGIPRHKAEPRSLPPVAPPAEKVDAASVPPLKAPDAPAPMPEKHVSPEKTPGPPIPSKPELTTRVPATATKAAKPAAAKTSPLTKHGGCEVGTADAKGSAASILDCIRFFNEVEGDARPMPKPRR